MKRCPKCARSYEDYWQVCLEDGEPLINFKQISKSPEVERLRTSIQRQQEEEREQEGSMYWKMSLFVALITCFIVWATDGAPFTMITLPDAPKVKIVDTIMYNTGALTGIFFTGMILALPLWGIWRAKKG